MFSVAPRFNSMRLNEFNLTGVGAPSDSTAMVNIKSVTGNVSGVNFGFGFDFEFFLCVSHDGIEFWGE